MSDDSYANYLQVKIDIHHVLRVLLIEHANTWWIPILTCGAFVNEFSLNIHETTASEKVSKFCNSKSEKKVIYPTHYSTKKINFLGNFWFTKYT